MDRYYSFLVFVKQNGLPKGNDKSAANAKEWCGGGPSGHVKLQPEAGSVFETLLGGRRDAFVRFNA